MRYTYSSNPSSLRSRSLSKRIGLRSARRHSLLNYRKLKRYNPVNQKRSSSKLNPRSGSLSKFRRTASKTFGVFLGIIIIGTLAGTIYLGATLASISASLPSPDELVERQADYSTKIYDQGGPKDGVLLYTIYGDQNREFVDISKVPEHTKWAFLAAEDVEFYNHKGLDLPGIAMAAFCYVRSGSGGNCRGASTISQQVVRNTLLYYTLGDAAYEKTLTRKAKEMLITMQVEQSFSKDEILQMYLNEVPLGGTNYGVQAASKAYFGKDVSELTLAESALLAGLVQQPGTYSPLFGSNPELAVERQQYVFDQLTSKKELINSISERLGSDYRVEDDDIAAAKDQVLVYAPARIEIKAPHFVFYVKQQLIETYGIDRVERGGLKVTTSLDWDLQQLAEQEIQAGVEKFRNAYNVHNAGMVVLDPKTGKILSMVGSVDYWAEANKYYDGNVNIATSLRQMGSSVKPYTYLTAIHKGYSPALLTPDIPLNFGAYKPKNWDGSYSGLILARQALVESKNLAALYTLQLVGGPDEFIKTAETLGITSLTDRSRYGLSITLGAAEMQLLEHTAAFGVYANGGIKNPTTAVLKVETSQGEVLEEYRSDQGKRIWDEKEIYLLNWMLCDLGGQGRIFPQYYKVGDMKLCGKTGTTDGPRDLTAFLYYPNLVVGVWTGNNYNQNTIGSSGQGWSTTVPLPIANSFMTRVVGKFGKATYSRPAGIVSGTVCRDSGLLAKEDSACTKVASVFIQGQLPAVDNAHVKKPICKETGNIATNEAAANAMGLIEYKTFLQIDLPNDAQQASLDKWLSASSAYGSMAKLPPEAECPLHLGPGNAPTVTFTSPLAGAQYYGGNSIDLTVAVNSLPGVQRVDFAFDGAAIGGTATAPYAYQYEIPAGASIGEHTFAATVTDNEGKTGAASVAITVLATAPSISVTMRTPSNGATISVSQQLRADVFGDYGAVGSLIFVFSNKATSQEFTFPGSTTGGGIWLGSLSTAIPADNYWLSARAVRGGVTYQSAKISVTVTPLTPSP